MDSTIAIIAGAIVAGLVMLILRGGTFRDIGWYLILVGTIILTGLLYALKLHPPS